MPVVPESRLGQLEFYEAHLPVWEANAASIGLTAGQLTSFEPLIIAARTNYNAQQPARNAAKAATQAFYDSIDNAHEKGADLIATIKTYASSTGNPAVYTTAQIPPPAPPTPTPPPEQPDDLSGAIDTFGVITLKWRATPKGASTGVFFFVERKVGSLPTATWTPLGATQDAQFQDAVGEAVIAGNVIQYRVQARRGADASAWSDQLAVDFTGGTDSIAGFVGGEEPAAEAA